MKDYLAAGVLVTIVGSIAALVTFSYRSGKNQSSVASSESAATEANAATDRVQAMAQAQADGPRTTAALLDRLDNGDA